MVDCLFCRIVAGSIPGDIVYRDDLVTAFRDIRPAAPTHILIIPNHHVPAMSETGAGDAGWLGRMLHISNELARQEGIAGSGYRLIANTGPDGGQEVLHVHLHLVGGRPLGRMLDRA